QRSSTALKRAGQTTTLRTSPHVSPRSRETSPHRSAHAPNTSPASSGRPVAPEYHGSARSSGGASGPAQSPEPDRARGGAARAGGAGGGGGQAPLFQPRQPAARAVDDLGVLDQQPPVGRLAGAAHGRLEGLPQVGRGQLGRQAAGHGGHYERPEVGAVTGF